MLNKSFILVLLLYPLLASSQEKISCRIVDENQQGIPFASIGIIEENYGAISFEDGSFFLEINERFYGDSLIVSAVGYKRKKVSYDWFVTNRPEFLMLEEDIKYLNEVAVVPDQLFFKTIGIKKSKSVNNIGISTPSKGITLAMLFDEIDGPSLIDEVNVTIGKINMDSVTIRCRIFEVDPETQQPGRDLLTENLLATSTQKAERLAFYINEDLWIDKPFFVGFEWLTTKKQYQQLINAKEAFPLDFIGEIVAANPGYESYNVNENKRIQFRDKSGAVYKKVKLTQEQTDLLNQRDDASPKLQFKIKMKGTKTYSGSPITGKWSKVAHEALISVKLGKTKKDLEPENREEAISFRDSRIPIEEIDEFLEDGMKQMQIPGLSMAIFNEKGIIHSATKGYADIEGEVLVDNQTIFEAASLSKPLFAYLFMKYVENGTIDLDTPLYTYLPNPDIAHDERYKKITARMALSHTSGFPNWRSDYEDNKLFISFDPGSAYQYSGEGFQYVAEVLAQLLATDDEGLEREFQTTIAKPLDMIQTQFVPKSNELNKKATPYKEGNRLKQSEQEGIFGAAFSVHSEALDFSKWLIALLNEEGLSEESFQELFKEQIKLKDQDAEAWTLGFGKYVTEDGVFYGHGGNNLGFTSAFFIDRDTQHGAVVFTNANQVSSFLVDYFLFLIEHE
ncbi:MAG: serine hydrolase [Ekhidna sp.]|nr:serine hydrolase [Ekhidna sp.]